MNEASGRRERLAVLALFALQSCAAAPLAFFRLFAGFRNYDDEGTFMLWDRHLFEGRALYDEVWNFYGPLPHLYRYLLHSIGALPLSHDAYRLLTLVNWLAAAALLSWGVLRLTRSLPLAALAHWMVLIHLLPITTEPAHPQEYVALLLGAVVVLASRLAAGGLAVAGLGAVTSAMLLTKVNAGAFLGLALGSSLVMAMPTGRAVRALRALAILALAILAPALMGGDARWDRWAGLALGASLGSLLLCACALEGERERRIGMRELGAFSAAALGALALGTAVPMLLGSSPGRLAWSVFVLPSRITTWVGSTLSIEPQTPIAALAGAAAFLAYRAGLRGGELGPRGRRRVAWARALLGLGIAGLALGVRSMSRYGALCLTLPVLWLLLIPASPRESRLSHWLPRLVLALTAVLESLYIYPVTGSQQAIGTLLIPICGLVCLRDGARELADLGWLAARRLALGRAAAGLLAAALTAGYAAQGVSAARSYRALTPLALPGAHLVRAHEEQAAGFGWLARNVAEHCDTFLAIPGFNSLYFWARRPAPSPASADRWFLFFEPEQRRELVDQLLAQPRPCFLANSRSTHYWLEKTRDPDSVRSLLRMVQDRFEVLGRTGDWSFLVPRGRPAPPLTQAAWIAPSDGVWVLIVSLPPELDRRVARISVHHVRREVLLADTEAGPGPAWPLRFESDAAPPADAGGAGTRWRRSNPLPGWVLDSLARRGYVVRLYDGDGRSLGSLPILR